VYVFILIWFVLSNLVLHVAGALKHQFDEYSVISGMTTRRPQAVRAA